MLQDFQNFFSYQISAGQILFNIFIALICGFIVSFFYRVNTGPGYNTSFGNSLVALCMITSVVIMVIGNNLARAFGLVGAMSIIRFRTAVKETIDIIFIFFSLAVGMASGVGLHLVAIVSSVAVGSILWLLDRSRLTNNLREEYLLQFTYFNSDDVVYVSVIEKYCKAFKLVNVKTQGEGDFMEFSYYIKLKDKVNSSTFIRELKKISGVGNVNVYMDNEYI